MAAGRPIAVTMGDPAGIGGEISLMAWRDHRRNLPPFFVIDDPARLERLAALTGLACPVRPIVSAADAAGTFDDGLPVLPVSRTVETLPGGDSTRAAAMVIESIDRAIDLSLAGDVAGMTTNPIRKSVLYGAGFASPGHTEYLAERAGIHTLPVMLLVSPSLRVVPVTIHLSVREAVAALTRDLIVETLTITARAMRTDFAIERPRIAVSGLNPHAGEDGHIGREEIDIVAPAIEAAREAAPDAEIFGPLAGDTMFHPAARAGYDVAVCMYHDQALIPLKTLDFDNGVNVTAGLPFVRTSPDHGTANDIAGRAVARPTSLVSAIRLARDIGDNRSKTSRQPAVA